MPQLPAFPVNRDVVDSLICGVEMVVGGCCLTLPPSNPSTPPPHHHPDPQPGKTEPGCLPTEAAVCRLPFIQPNCLIPSQTATLFIRSRVTQAWPAGRPTSTAAGCKEFFFFRKKKKWRSCHIREKRKLNYAALHYYHFF